MKKMLKWTLVYLFIGVIVGISLPQIKKDNVLYPSYQIRDSIDILYNEEELTDVDLSTYEFSGLKKGDDLELNFQVGELDLEQPMIALLIYHCNVRVYDNGQVMYEYGWDEGEGKRMAPSGIHMIPLQNTKNHQIRICLKVL